MCPNIFKKPEKEWAARVEADVFDAGFFLSGPLSDRWQFAVAGRRSYIDAILGFVAENEWIHYTITAIKNGSYTDMRVYKNGVLFNSLLPLSFLAKIITLC